MVSFRKRGTKTWTLCSGFHHLCFWVRLCSYFSLTCLFGILFSNAADALWSDYESEERLLCWSLFKHSWNESAVWVSKHETALLFKGLLAECFPVICYAVCHLVFFPFFIVVPPQFYARLQDSQKTPITDYISGFYWIYEPNASFSA